MPNARIQNEEKYRSRFTNQALLPSNPGKLHSYEKFAYTSTQKDHLNLTNVPMLKFPANPANPRKVQTKNLAKIWRCHVVEERNRTTLPFDEFSKGEQYWKSLKNVTDFMGKNFTKEETANLFYYFERTGKVTQVLLYLEGAGTFTLSKLPPLLLKWSFIFTF